MPLIVSEVIDEIRDLTFVGAHDVPNKTILRACARAERELFEAVLVINENALAKVKEFDADAIQTALDDSTPLSLPAFYRVLDGAVSYDDVDDVVFHLVVAAMRNEAEHVAPSGYLLGQKLYLRAQSEWDSATALRLRYVPMPEVPTQLSQEFTAPDICQRFLVLRGAGYVRQMLSAGKKDADLEMEAAIAKESLITTLGMQDSSAYSAVRIT